MQGKSVCDSPNLRIVIGVRPNSRVPANALNGRLPTPHHDVLNDRQLVGVLVRIIQESLDELRIDFRHCPFDGARDRHRPLVAGEPRHQELTACQCFRQPMEMRAVADEVGAHRNENMHPDGIDAVRSQQEAHERGRLIPLQ
ncbi:MAG: hypothetical protein JO312_20165 [Hyphomicrobiales bacterium]|nr:hypothetical protein [Hyphomicrobiales bacterium]